MPIPNLIFFIVYLYHNMQAHFNNYVMHAAERYDERAREREREREKDNKM